MFNKIYLRLLGVLDLVLIVWIVISDIFVSKIPLIDDLIEYIDLASKFSDQYYVYIISIIGIFVVLSTIASGILMLYVKRVGIYISLFQSPFRLLLVIPPTFFFIGKLSEIFIVPAWFFFIIIMALEVLKIIYQVAWLRDDKSDGE